MAKTSRHRANGTKQAKRLSMSKRRRRLLMKVRMTGPLIPDDVLRALAASALPPEKHAYDMKLREMLRGA